MKKILPLAAATMLAASLSPAHAHEADDILFRAGAALVAPDDSSSEVSVGGTPIAGSSATVGNDTQLGMTFGYMITDSIGVELLAATPFSHQIDLKGGGLDGRFARTKQLPPTVTLQYFPRDNEARWQPYVGVGLNYTTFFDESLSSERKDQGFSSLSLSDSWGAALQIGSDWMITDRLMLNASVWHMDIDTTARARLGEQRVKVDVDIDPWVYRIGLGYKF